jgi:hypothetical protein
MAPGLSLAGFQLVIALTTPWGFPPAASGWSGRRVGLAPTGKRRLITAHTLNGPSRLLFSLRSVDPLTRDLPGPRMSTRARRLAASSCKKAMRVWSPRSTKNSLLDVGMTVMGALLSKSSTGSVAAERSSHSLRRRGLTYIFRASAHDDFFSQAMFGPLDGDHPGRGQEAGLGARLGQFSHCCDQFRHRGNGCCTSSSRPACSCTRRQNLRDRHARKCRLSRSAICSTASEPPACLSHKGGA